MTGRAKISLDTELARGLDTLKGIKNLNDLLKTLGDAPQPLNPDLYKRINASVIAESDTAGKTFNSMKDRYITQADVNVQRTLDTFADLGEKVRSSVTIELQNTIDAIKHSSLYNLLVDVGLSRFMEKPEIFWVGEEFGGDPVYYVNGILTTKSDIVATATLIAIHLDRKVGIIFNPSCIDMSFGFNTGTPGCSSDFEEAVYDRCWPAICAVELKNLDPPSQRNRTTRQLAWLLYHNIGNKISFITHSQGCIQMRNAMFTVGMFGKETDVRRNLAWVELGTPLNNNELWPKPRKFVRLRNKDDIVDELIGLNGVSPDKLPCVPQHYASYYVDLVSNELPGLLEPPRRSSRKRPRSTKRRSAERGTGRG